MSTPAQPIFDMSKAKPIFDMSKAQPISAKTPEPEDELTRLNRQMTAAVSGQTTTLSPEEKAQAAAGKQAGMKAAAETVGATIGGEAMPALKGLVGALIRAVGSGFGAGATNVGVQAATPGQKVDPIEALKTAGAFGGTALVGEGIAALGEARAYLRDLLFTSEGKVTPLGKAVTHPIDSGTDYAVRKVLGVPSPPPATGKAPSVPITQSPNFDPAAYRAGAAARTSQAPTATPSGAVTEPSRIVPPSAGVPGSARTLQSYSRDILIKLARGGDIDALKELVRNPGDVDVESAVPNARYLLGTKPGATIGEQLKAKGQR